MTTRATLVGEAEARYAALAGLVHGGRVLDLREHSDARCIDALVTAGAVSITVCAPDDVRHQLTTQNVDLQLVAPITLPLAFGSGSFDVVICFDLMERAAADPGWVSALRDVLTPEGAIVIATHSAEETAAIMGPTFGVATVFAQSPVVGHMLYDLAIEELEPELDRTWTDDGDDEPASYMIVFAPDARHSGKLTLVQMPFSSLAMTTTAVAAPDAEALAPDAAALAAERDALAYELANARNELAVLTGELETGRAEIARLSAHGPATPQELEDELARHRNDRASLEAQIADLLEESSAMSVRRAEWQARLDGAEQEIATERARVAELTSQTGSGSPGVAQLEEYLRAEQARSAGLEQELATERVRASELHVAYADAHQRIATLEDAAARDRLAVAEAQDAVAVERANTSKERAGALAAREEQQRRIEELQRTLDASRRRGDELARSLDADRQQLIELKDGLESERQRVEELRDALSRSDGGRSASLHAEGASSDASQPDSEQADLARAAEEAQEVLAETRRQATEATEALRNEQVRNEQLLARLVELEQQLGEPPGEKEMESPSGGNAADGES